MDQSSLSLNPNSKIENELYRLMIRSRQMIRNGLQPDLDWNEEKIIDSGKLLKEIEMIQRTMKMINKTINVKLFNESRDCCEELKKFLINISKNTSSYNIDLKQSVKMIDYCFKNLVNANGCTVTIPSFIPSLLPQTISNDTEEMKEIVLGSGIHFKVKPMNPISNPWMNKLLRARILAPIIHQLDHVSQSMPIQINVKNVPIETDITAISTAYCIDPNIKIYYHFETAIADGLVSIESQENVAKYDNVIIYLIVGEFPSTSLQKLDNNNEQCDATTHRSLLFKFQPSNFIIIEKINTFDDCDESRELLIANYIRINVKPKCP